MNGLDKRRMDEQRMEVGVNESSRRNVEECEMRNWQRSATQRLEENEARKTENVLREIWKEWEANGEQQQQMEGVGEW